MALKKTLRFILLLFASVASLIMVYLCIAFFLSLISVGSESTTSKEVTIYLRTNGVHTDLVLPVKTQQTDWRKFIAFENMLSNDTLARYIAFGWGDKGFYLETANWEDLKLSTALKAAMGLSSSAIHITLYRKLTEDRDCIRIEISKEHYAQLVGYIQKSFITDASGNFVCIKLNGVNAHYGKNDAFYEAHGSYSIFHTCNTWANNGLKSCGQKACLWTPFDKGIFYHYQPYGKR